MAGITFRHDQNMWSSTHDHTHFIRRYDMTPFFLMLQGSWNNGSFMRHGIALLHRNAKPRFLSYKDNSPFHMTTSSDGIFFRIIGPSCGVFTGHRWIPLKKGQSCGSLMFPLIRARTNGWINSRDAGDLGRHLAYYDVTVMHEGKISSTE